jgi:hypothetical protein
VDPRLSRTLDRLRSSRFAELQGARLSATIPLPERLLNEIIAAVLPPAAPVRDVSVRPQPGNRLAVRARLAKVDFLPPFTVTLEIERQPQLPDGPLVLRMLSLPGLIALAGSGLSAAASLPPGIRLDKDRLVIDLRTLLEQRGYGDVVPLVNTLRVTTEEGRVLLNVELSPPPSAVPA